MNLIIKKLINKIFFTIFIFFIISYLPSRSNEIKDVIIEGNQRISNDTILLFSEINTGEKITNDQINRILKNLYDSNFFEDVSVKIIDNKLIITVVESPIIDKVEYTGIKADKIINALDNIIKLKSRSSYNSFLIENDRKLIKEYLKDIGYYFSEVQTVVENMDNNLVNVVHKIEMGNKAKIKKISFIGNKIYKDNKLKSLIISEEYKFWKFISGRKYLNEQTIKFDTRLLKNFYLNKGFYDVEINSSFAKLLNNQEFELIFNINP